MNKKEKLYIGIDIGGTKISGALVKNTGDILVNKKIPTPRKTSSRQFVNTISTVVSDVMKEAGIADKYLSGIGMGVPGVVDTDRGVVVVAPNLNLRNVNIVRDLKTRFKVKVIAGNDVNVGLLGEQWLGAGSGIKNVIGLFPGTGVGGAIIIDGKMLTGIHGAAAELGHMIVESKGPSCTCGNKGCLEAAAGRWAIERDIRAEIKAGKKSKIKQLSGGRLAVIKSRVLSKALKARDPVVTRVMKRASETLGYACRTLRHIFDPEMIIFGGGIIEACSDFMMPIIRKTALSDPFFSKFSGFRIVESLLGDDAVLLGAVALVMSEKDRKKAMTGYPELLLSQKNNELTVSGRTISKDIYIRADGKLKKRDVKRSNGNTDGLHNIGKDELKKVCKKRPEVLILATRCRKGLTVTLQGENYLKKIGADYRILPLEQAVDEYRKIHRRKAILIHGKCL
ncbi:MAG: ROK family protein [Candidatus Aureabacteria bacterium]|nr:ROK family protein [Candidatus Auribacterota bacterium]